MYISGAKTLVPKSSSTIENLDTVICLDSQSLMKSIDIMSLNTASVRLDLDSQIEPICFSLDPGPYKV